MASAIAQMTTIARKAITNANKHVVCGYGRCGQNLGHMLKAKAFLTSHWTLTPIGNGR
jgi:S-adenosylhomocysteine hydrolase